MLRVLTHNVVGPQRRLPRPPHRSQLSLFHPSSPKAHHKYVLTHLRFLSTPQPSTGPDPSQKSPVFSSPQPSSQQRKAKLGLGPGPIKPPRPSTHSAHHLPLAPTASPHKVPPTSASSSPLNQVKETAKRDIEEAEAHGILTSPPPGANWFKRTVHKGIQLAKFYFRGVKLIIVRRREISEIRARIKAGGSPLTRAEFRFIQTQKDDVNKVIPFIVIALLLEEVIPLIAIYAPSFLPSTCILPSQQTRIREKRTQKALEIVHNSSSLFAGLQHKEAPPGYLPIDAIRHSDASTAVCGLLGLSTIGNSALRIHRIRGHLRFLEEDDRLLLQDGSPLSEKELTEALQERGIVDHQLSLKSKQSKLKWWLTSIQSSDPDNTLPRRLSLIARNSANLYI